MICSGDNFFKPASYTIEAMCAKSYEDTTERLKEIEAKILEKRNDLRQFETEYRKVCQNIFVPSLLCDNKYSIILDVLLHFKETLTE